MGAGKAGTGAIGRVRQGVRALLAWAHPVDHALVQATLSEPLRRVFYQLRRGEQLHSLNVLRGVLSAAESAGWADEVPSALRVAALLHDCGKARAPFLLPERVIVVLVRAAAPSLAKRWGSGDESGLRTWRRPFLLSAQHPAWGAEMAAAAGAEPLAVRLIAAHQTPLAVAGGDDHFRRLLAALQAADDAN